MNNNINKINTSKIKHMLIEKYNNDISQYARSLGFNANINRDSYLFENGKIQIFLKKSNNKKVDKVRAKKALNEAYEYSSGFFGNMGNGAPYLDYKVLSFNHSLEQKTDRKTEISNRFMSSRIIHIGDFVTGKSKFSKKQYSGVIQRFSRDSNNDIITVYILAKDFGKIVPLDPETVKLSSPLPIKKYHIKWLDAGNQMIHSPVQMGGISAFI